MTLESMHISNAFFVGVIIGANTYLTIWLYIFWAKIWRIEIISISISSNTLLKYTYTFIIKGTKLVMDYVPYIAGVRYLGYLQEDYENLDEADKRFAFLHQSGFRRFVIAASPYIQVVVVICLSIHFFDTNKAFKDNFNSICLHLKQLSLYSLNIHKDKTYTLISHLNRDSLFAFLLCYYGLLFFVFQPLNTLFEYLTLQKNKTLYLLAFTGLGISFVFCWFRVPYCIASILSLSTARIMYDLLQFAIALYFCAYFCAGLVYLFLRYSSSLAYTKAEAELSSE